MAVDVSKIPNNDKFDPVRKALLNLQSQLEEEGQIAYDGEITIQGGTNMTSTPSQSFTVNQSGNSTITINADTQSDENFTTALKDKLDDIEAFAQVNTVDSVNSQTGAVVLDTDDVQESATPTNKYYTEARFNASLATKDTDDLSEGVGNLYYTDTRFDNRLATKDTDDLSEGVANLYYTDTRFDNRFATKDTDDLSEGTTNFYYTEARFDASLAGKTTDDLTEGSNLYYTDARARAAISDGDGLDYNATTGVMSHTDTSSQSSVNNSGGSVIQDVTLDTFGHITGLASTNLDDRYPQVAFKTIEANTGSEVADTKTDTLAIKGGNLVNTSVADVSGAATVTVDVSLTDVRFDENGNRVARGVVYWTGTGVPTTAPTGSFDFNTNILTVSGTWSEVPPTTGYSETVYYISRYTVTEGYALVFQAPVASTGFEGLVTFNGLSEELGANGLTIIDGGRIQTGEISSVGFNSGATATDFSADGTLMSLDSGNIISENFKIINGDASFRGDLSASTGTFGNVEINTSHPNVFDPAFDNYIARVIADGGTIEAIDNIYYLLSDNTQYAIYSDKFKLDQNGNAAFSGDLRAASGTFSGSLVAADGTFGGELTAATGTFSGALSAATGTFAGALSAATGTFAGSLSAATGTFSGDISAATGTFSGGLNVSDGTFAVDSSTGTITAGLVDITENQIDIGSDDAAYSTKGQVRFNDYTGSQIGSLSGEQVTVGPLTLDYLKLAANFGLDLDTERLTIGDNSWDVKAPYSYNATSGYIPILGGLKLNWIRRTNVSGQVSGSWASAFTTVFGAVATKGNNSSVYETANNAATVSYTNTNYYLDVNDLNKTVFIIAIGI